MTIDALPQIDEAVSYAKLVNALEEMIKIRDGVQWSVGDALQGVETRYSDCTIEAIADDVGMSPSSLYDWRTLSAFYVPIIRQHYTEKGLFYSHFRIAYREFPTIDGAYSFLDLCVAEKWTVRGAAIEAKKRKGQTVSPGVTVTLTFHVENGRIWVEGLEGIQISEGQAYTGTLKVRE